MGAIIQHNLGFMIKPCEGLGLLIKLASDIFRGGATNRWEPKSPSFFGLPAVRNWNDQAELITGIAKGHRDCRDCSSSYFGRRKQVIKQIIFQKSRSAAIYHKTIKQPPMSGVPARSERIGGDLDSQQRISQSASTSQEYKRPRSNEESYESPTQGIHGPAKNQPESIICSKSFSDFHEAFWRNKKTRIALLAQDAGQGKHTHTLKAKMIQGSDIGCI